MRSHWPVIPAIRLLWAIMTPLGRPVEPLVYITTARSDGWGFNISLPPERKMHSNEKKKFYTYTYIYTHIHIYAVSTCSAIPQFYQDTQRQGEIHTIDRKHAQLLYVLHAVDGQARWVTLSVHPLVVHIDHMPEFWDP